MHSSRMRTDRGIGSGIYLFSGGRVSAYLKGMSAYLWGVCLPGGGVCLPVEGVSDTPWTDTFWQTPPSGQTAPLWANTLLGRHPRADTHWADTPLPGRHPLGRDPSLGRYPLGRHPSIPHPLPCEQTDTCENITFPHTSYAVGKYLAWVCLDS